MRKFITDGAGLPKWSSPVSHAVVVDGMCYLSGQLSIDESGVYVPGTAVEEARRAFENLFAALRAAEFSVSDLAFVDIAFIDLADAPEVNQLYAELFAQGMRPARTIYQAAALQGLDGTAADRSGRDTASCAALAARRLPDRVSTVKGMVTRGGTGTPGSGHRTRRQSL